MKWKWILCAVLMAGLLCSCGKKEEPPIQEEPGAVEPVTAGNAEEFAGQADRPGEGRPTLFDLP